MNQTTGKGYMYLTVSKKYCRSNKKSKQSTLSSDLFIMHVEVILELLFISYIQADTVAVLFLKL